MQQIIGGLVGLGIGGIIIAAINHPNCDEGYWLGGALLFASVVLAHA
jgi:hypothetical protein